MLPDESPSSCGCLSVWNVLRIPEGQLLPRRVCPSVRALTCCTVITTWPLPCESDVVDVVKDLKV